MAFALGDGEMRMNWSDGSSRMDVRARGTIVFSDNLADVQSVSDGGLLTIRDWSTLIPHTVELRGDGGRITRKYYVGGIERPWSDEAQHLLAEELPLLVRRSGLGAESRVKAILAREGVGGVLAEITRLDGDYVRRIYFAQLVNQAPLDPATVIPVLQQVGRQMTSDFERGQVLRLIANKVPLDESAAAEYVKAVDGMKGDFERRRALTALFEAHPHAPGVANLAIRSAGDMSSDFERGEVLRTALANGAIGDSQALFAALGRMDSAFEKHRVLTQVMQQPSPSLDLKKGVLAAAASMASDFEAAGVLSTFLQKFGVDPTVEQPFFAATAALHGDFERGKLLTAVAARGPLSPTGLRALLASVGGMSSDFERANVLLAVVRAQKLDETSREAFLKAADTIKSQMEQNRVLAALVRTERHQ